MNAVEKCIEALDRLQSFSAAVNASLANSSSTRSAHEARVSKSFSNQSINVEDNNNSNIFTNTTNNTSTTGSLSVVALEEWSGDSILADLASGLFYLEQHVEQNSKLDEELAESNFVQESLAEIPQILDLICRLTVIITRRSSDFLQDLSQFVSATLYSNNRSSLNNVVTSNSQSVPPSHSTNSQTNNGVDHSFQLALLQHLTATYATTALESTWSTCQDLHSFLRTLSLASPLQTQTITSVGATFLNSSSFLPDMQNSTSFLQSLIQEIAFSYTEFIEHVRVLCVHIACEFSVLCLRFGSNQTVFKSDEQLKQLDIRFSVFEDAISLSVNHYRSASALGNCVPIIFRYLLDILVYEPSTSMAPLQHALFGLHSIVYQMSSVEDDYRSLVLRDLSMLVMERVVFPISSFMASSIRKSKSSKVTSVAVERRISVELFVNVLKLIRIAAHEHSLAKSDHAILYEQLFPILEACCFITVNIIKNVNSESKTESASTLSENLADPQNCSVADLFRVITANFDKPLCESSDILAHRLHATNMIFEEVLQLIGELELSSSQKDLLFQFCLDFEGLHTISSQSETSLFSSSGTPSTNQAYTYKELLKPFQVFSFSRSTRRENDIVMGHNSIAIEHRLQLFNQGLASAAAADTLSIPAKSSDSTWKKLKKLVTASDKMSNDAEIHILDLVQTQKSLDNDSYFTEFDSNMKIQPVVSLLYSMKSTCNAMISRLNGRVSSFNNACLSKEDFIESNLCFSGNRMVSFRAENELDFEMFQEIRNVAGQQVISIKVANGFNPYAKRVLSQDYQLKQVSSTPIMLSNSQLIYMQLNSEEAINDVGCSKTAPITPIISTDRSVSPSPHRPKTSPVRTFSSSFDSSKVSKTVPHSLSKLRRESTSSEPPVVAESTSSFAASLKNAFSLFDKKHNPESPKQSIVRAITAEFDFHDSEVMHNDPSLPPLENNDEIFALLELAKVTKPAFPWRQNSSTSSSSKSIISSSTKEPPSAEDSLSRWPRLFLTHSGFFLLEEQRRNAVATMSSSDMSKFSTVLDMFPAFPVVSVSFYDKSSASTTRSLSPEARLVLSSMTPMFPRDLCSYLCGYRDLPEIDQIPYIQHSSAHFVVHAPQAFSKELQISAFSSDLVAIVWCGEDVVVDRLSIENDLFHEGSSYILAIIVRKLPFNLIKIHHLVNSDLVPENVCGEIYQRCGSLINGSLCVQKSFGALIRDTAVNCHMAIVQIISASKVVKCNSATNSCIPYFFPNPLCCPGQSVHQIRMNAIEEIQRLVISEFDSASRNEDESERDISRRRSRGRQSIAEFLRAICF